MTGRLDAVGPVRRALTLAAAAVLVVAASAVTGGFVAPRGALACWDSGCQGQDPVGSGCINSGNLVDGSADANDGAYVIQLGYSTACGSNWGTTFSVPNGCEGGHPICSGVHLQQSCCSGVTNTTDAGPFFDTNTHRTTMLSGASSADRVCTWSWNACTAWH